MKRIWTLFISIVMLIGLSGCFFDEKPPPARAFFNKTSAYGMQYHIILYDPASNGGTHTMKHQSWTYSPFHIYTDRLGTLTGEDVIFKNLDECPPPFEENGQNNSDIHLSITKDTINISGVKGGIFNGTYKVETSPPSSWGIEIDKGATWLCKEFSH